MLAVVRNRRALITAVEPFDAGPRGRFHLASLEYTEADGPLEDRLVWEREPGASLLEPTALPDPVRDAAMPAEQYDAVVRAARWSALTPYVDPDGSHGPLDRLPIASPFHGALQVEDFQLVPLLHALRMPRIALLLADDVGLGKTIEAGLILAELILRRRVRRVLIACPASLRYQWQQEMRDKFSLGFDVVDREETNALRKRMGLDANPWRAYARIITSYHYLKQPDVLEQFRSACRTPEQSPHLPWDLLIVDEAHNLTPAPFGEESDLSQMLRQIAPHFEHKLFLTATPHNGYTRSFTGLLERLDPVRFTQRAEFTDAERQRAEQVVIRRLKREINERTRPPRFSERRPQALPLHLSTEERALSFAYQGFRRAVRALVAEAGRSEQLAGAFAVEILGKRLLSSPATFADSWKRYLAGMREDERADASEVQAARRATEDETGDDREAESRTATAARTVGAWLIPLAPRLQADIAAVDAALASLGLLDAVLPLHDARFNALSDVIGTYLRRSAGRWRDDERLVVFTEYKCTLDLLHTRLLAAYPEDGRIRVLYGGMDERERDSVKKAFNDAADPVRVLIATDTASEGLNLQETARLLLHYDVPWNPSRLEQRNGRLDRHSQARDVTIFHFATDDDADLQFLGRVVKKVETMREDLGSVGEVFDAAFQRRFLDDAPVADVLRTLDEDAERARGRTHVPRDATVPTGEDELNRLRSLAEEIDLTPGTLRNTLDIALGLGVGWPRLEPVDPTDRDRMRLCHPIPPRWAALVDDVLRLGSSGGGHKGPLPALVFDPSYYITEIGGRPVYRPAKDTALLHLGHPLFVRALAFLAQARYPGGGQAGTCSRWTVRRGGMPAGADALLILTVEELAVNELRETFHHWVRSIRYPIRNGELQDALPHEPVATWGETGPAKDGDEARARTLWDEVAGGVRSRVKAEAARLTERLVEVLALERGSALQAEQDRYRSRQGEVSKLIQDTSMQKLERELAALQRERNQLHLLDQDRRFEDLTLSAKAKEEELSRMQQHYEELRAQLTKERDRIIDHLIPKRYTLHGSAQVFPVGVEVRV